MSKIKVMTIFGTRPEAIKMAPIILELQRQAADFSTVTVVSAQHREMLDQVLEIFHIKPDYDLDIMKKKQSLDQITTNIITHLGSIIDSENPDIILVHGDTTTTFAAGLVAFYHKIPIGHVEAGLRTWNKYDPFPEEMNRQLTDVLSDLYFAPTTISKRNLLEEHHNENNIFITGNTAIDALKQTVQQGYRHEIDNIIDSDKRLILVTMHRRENQGQPMVNVFSAIREVVNNHPDIEVVYPVHLSPVVQELAKRELGGHPRIHLIDPLDVIDFHNLSAKSFFIMTDSGGVQEEAPSLSKPVLVLRETTERPEGVDAGTLKLVGTDYETVQTAMTDLLDNKSEYRRMADAKNPYGDGAASLRILDAIRYHFGCLKKRPADFS